MMKGAAFLTILLLVAGQSLFAQPGATDLRIRISDAESGAALVGARVIFPGLNQIWIANSEGFAFPTAIPRGEHQVVFTMPGYQNLEHTMVVGAESTTDREIALAPIPLDSPVTVRGSTSSVDGMASLRLRVTDSSTNRPLPEARIDFPTLRRSWLTDSLGWATIEAIPASQQRVEVTKVGYGPAGAVLDIESGAGAVITFRLVDAAVGLDPITVVGQAAATFPIALSGTGFLNRYGRGLGRQLNRADIEERGVIEPSSLLSGIPGIRLVPGPFGKLTPVTRAWGGLNSGSEVCSLDIYLDGMQWFDELDDLPLEWIEGIEVYSGPAEIPVAFSRTSRACGVILVWTR